MTQFKDLRDVISYLKRATNYELFVPGHRQVYNLAKMRRLLGVLGNPQDTVRMIHIAGTKGKGSTAMILDGILRKAGYKTGLYTSPHLVRLLERIQIKGRPIKGSEFVWAMNRMGPHLEAIRPTFFEIMTAAAFLVFALKRVDFGIVEVGLGGRLDSTNIIKPAACVITRIELDHQQVLGSRLGSIAKEKAGIIKPGVPVVIAPQRPSVFRVLRRVTNRFNTPCIWIGQDIRIDSLRQGDSTLCFRLLDRGDPLSVCMPIVGPHQSENVALAIGVLKALRIGLKPRSVRDALKGIRLPGRTEVLPGCPKVVVDVAHNPASIHALVRSLRSMRPRRVMLIFGTSRDKLVIPMLRSLIPQVETVIFSQAPHPRAFPAEELAELTQRFIGKNSIVIHEPRKAFNLARSMARPSELILITGSFYLVGEILKYIRR